MNTARTEDSAETGRSGRRRHLELFMLPPEHPSGGFEVFFAITGFVALLAGWLLPLDAIAHWAGECRFKSLTGLPCASCGITRGLLALSGGDLLGALAWNPLFVSATLAWLAYAPIAAWLWLARRGRPRLRLASRASRIAAIVLLVSALAANWIFLVAAGR